MEAMMTENYSPRIRVDIVAAYSCAGSYTFGIVKNISRSGLFLESRKLLPVDTELSLRMRLPDEQQKTAVEARVVWSKRATQLCPAGMGMEFVRLSLENRKKLCRFIHMQQPQGYARHEQAAMISTGLP
jgi:uncharacterized protein (TIGR02266 family)